MTDSPKPPKPDPDAHIPAGFVPLKALRSTAPGDPLEEIKRLYYATGPKTIAHDLAAAIELLKQMPTEEDRERAAVYMDGLAEMRADWERTKTKRRAARPGTHPALRKPRGST